MAAAVMLNEEGQAWVAGTTSSSDFPIKEPIQPQLRSQDSFLTLLSTNGESVIFSTYYGTDKRDRLLSATRRTDGSIYLLQERNSDGDYSISCFEPRTRTTMYETTFVGDIYARVLTLDSAGNVFLCGLAGPDTVPLVDPIQQFNDSFYDGFIAVFDPSLSKLLFFAFKIALFHIPRRQWRRAK